MGCGTDSERDRANGSVLAQLARRPGGAAGGFMMPRRLRAGGEADGGRGKVAGLPEGEDLLQASENAREDGGDQGVQSRGHSSATSLCRGRGSELGQLAGQTGWMRFHSLAF